MRVMCVYVAASRNAQRNLGDGLASDTWGFKRDDPQYRSDFDWVVFGHHHKAGGPRAAGGLNSWVTSTIDIVLGRARSPYYEGHAPHWQDEIAEGRVIYPHRFGFVTTAMTASMTTDPSGPLGTLSKGLFQSGIEAGRGIIVEVADMGDLRDSLGLSRTGDVDLSHTPGRVSLPGEASEDGLIANGSRRRRGAGRVNDVLKRQAIERHAVALAKQHLGQLGWEEIKDLGAPYDLVCSQPGQEKHVEVKGTTSAGATVEFTPNEVWHFRNCPEPGGADLIVVNDINVVVNSAAGTYSATGGILRHFAGYTAPPAQLQASRWLATIP